MSGTPSQYGDFGQRGDSLSKHDGVRRPDERGYWPAEDPPHPVADAPAAPSAPPPRAQPVTPGSGVAPTPTPPPPLAVPFGYVPPTGAPPTQPVLVLGTPGGNGMGIAGLVVSLVGLVFCAGVLWPVSLGLSVAGMKREPKGLAIAGLVLSCVNAMLFFVMFLPFFILPLVLGFSAASTMPTTLTTREQADLDQHISTYALHNGALPAALSDLNLADPSMLADAWSTPYRYTLASQSTTAYTIDSAGPDLLFGTSDDITHSGFAAMPAASPQVTPPGGPSLQRPSTPAIPAAEPR